MQITTCASLIIFSVNLRDLNFDEAGIAAFFSASAASGDIALPASAPVPADRTAIHGIFLFFNYDRSAASAIGERQVLPEHTNKMILCFICISSERPHKAV